MEESVVLKLDRATKEVLSEVRVSSALLRVLVVVSDVAALTALHPDASATTWEPLTLFFLAVGRATGYI